DRASTLTRALIEALDEPDAQDGLTLGHFFSTARESPEIAASVRCIAHVRGRFPFEMLPQVERPAGMGSEPILPPPSEPDLATRPVTDREISAPPAPRAPYRSEVDSIPTTLLEEQEPESLPEPRAPFRSDVASIPVIVDEPAPLIVDEPAPEPP